MKYRLGISILFLQILLGCEFYDFRLIVVNKSACSISVDHLDSSQEPNANELNSAYHYIEMQIDTNSERRMRVDGRDGWSNSIRSNKNGKLNLIVFRTDSIKKYKSIEALLNKKMYTIYSFSLDQLEFQNWKVEINE